MQLILYGSFVYMVVHLIKFSFKKGEKLKLEWESKYLSMYREGRWKEVIFFSRKLSLKKKAWKSRKHKLLLVEIERSYKEPFSKETVREMIEQRYAYELMEEIKMVYDFKEREEFKKFRFDETQNMSPRLQFLEIKKEITDIQMSLFFQVLFEQYKVGKMVSSEISEWEPKFVQLGLLEEKKKEMEGYTLADALGATETNNKQPEDAPKPIIVREATKKKTARFDSSLERVDDENMEKTELTLKMNEKQAEVMMAALDLYARLGVGQLQEVLQHPSIRPREYNRLEIEGLLDMVKMEVFPELEHPNAYHSISSEKTVEESKIAIEMNDVVRHTLAWHKKPEGSTWDVRFQKPQQYSEEKHIECLIE